MIRIVGFYLKLLFRAGPGANEEAIAGWCLLCKKSLRGSAANESGIRTILRWWYYAQRRIFSRGPAFHTDEQGQEGVALWDNTFRVLPVRCAHVKFNGGVPPRLLVCREQIMPQGWPAKISASLLLTLLLPFFLVYALFGKQTHNAALLFQEWVELYGLWQICRKQRVSYLYYYCPYENDANAMYLFLKQQGITVNKIPSPNLLSIHNTQLLTDVLTLTSPSQQDELQEYRATLRYSRLEHWLPEQFADYLPHYAHKALPQPRSIGLYSHGTWMRKKNQHVQLGFGDEPAEEEFLRVLSVFLKAHREFSCTVFLHPKEKKADPASVRAFYDGLFGAGNYNFGEQHLSSALAFDTVDIGVGAVSTILFERLLLGFKTVFYPAGIKSFPLKGAAISAICPVTEKEFSGLVEGMASLSADDFFKNYGLGAYTLGHWKPGFQYGQEN